MTEQDLTRHQAKFTHPSHSSVSSEGHLNWFRQLDDLLTATTALWQVTAFDCDRLPWEAQFPALAAKVWSIADDELDDIDAKQTVLVSTLAEAIGADFPALIQALPLLVRRLPEIADDQRAQPLLSAADEPHFSAHIKGRKWQQISLFTGALSPKPLPFLEWCAGKGHLGRLIAKVRNTDVLSLEWQADLCEQGRVFANKWQLKQTFVCDNAFAPQVMPFKPKQHAVALHACGDLHVRLLRQAAQAGTEAISISPCCYHLIQASHYLPLSAVGQKSCLCLRRHDLQLPLQLSVIANAKQQALRHQEIAWRLAFDSLQRDIRGIDCYLPLPAIKQSQLTGQFADFCRWAAECKSLPLPATIDYGHYLALGLQRQRLTRRIDLVAHLFRLALEQWLLLDRVRFLEEQGYRVSLSEFCPIEITPRNALIRAEK